MFDASAVLAKGWEITKDTFGVSVAAALIYLVVPGCASWVIQIPAQIAAAALNNQIILFVGMGLSQLVSMAVSVFLFLGYTKFCIATVRGEKPEIGMLFSQSGQAIQGLVAMMLLILACTVGFLFLILPGIYIGMRSMLCFHFIVHRNMEAVEALQASWAATEGQFGNLFVYWLLSMGIYFLGFLACCVGIFAAIPVIFYALAIIYMTLSQHIEA